MQNGKRGAGVVRVHNILADRRILRSQGGVSVTRRTAERSVSGIAKNRCAIYGEITRFSGKVTRRKCAGIQKTDQLSVGTGRLAPQMMTFMHLVGVPPLRAELIVATTEQPALARPVVLLVPLLLLPAIIDNVPAAVRTTITTIAAGQWC